MVLNKGISLILIIVVTEKMIKLLNLGRKKMWISLTTISSSKRVRGKEEQNKKNTNHDITAERTALNADEHADESFPTVKTFSHNKTLFMSLFSRWEGVLSCEYHRPSSSSSFTQPEYKGRKAKATLIYKIKHLLCGSGSVCGRSGAADREPD